MDETNFIATFMEMPRALHVVLTMIFLVLLVYTLRAITQVTCFRQTTLRHFQETTERRRRSKWRVVRMLECVMEARGPGSSVWSEYMLLKEMIETGLQIFNVLDYAARGYSPTALYMYLAVVAANAAVWWMLTLPRTIRTTRAILVANALISTFYVRCLPVVYVNTLVLVLFPWNIQIHISVYFHVCTR